MLPQVPPLPLEGLVVCLFLLPKIIGSGSSGELSCSTDLKIYILLRITVVQLIKYIYRDKVVGSIDLEKLLAFKGDNVGLQSLVEAET